MHRIRWGVVALWLFAGTGLARANGLESVTQKLAGRDFQNYAKALSKALDGPAYRMNRVHTLEISWRPPAGEEQEGGLVGTLLTPNAPKESFARLELLGIRVGLGRQGDLQISRFVCGTPAEALFFAAYNARTKAGPSTRVIEVRGRHVLIVSGKLLADQPSLAADARRASWTELSAGSDETHFFAVVRGKNDVMATCSSASGPFREKVLGRLALLRRKSPHPNITWSGDHAARFEFGEGSILTLSTSGSQSSFSRAPSPEAQDSLAEYLAGAKGEEQGAAGGESTGIVGGIR